MVINDSSIYCVSRVDVGPVVELFTQSLTDRAGRGGICSQPLAGPVGRGHSLGGSPVHSDGEVFMVESSVHSSVCTGR
jgi:hypothetical protein